MIFFLLKATLMWIFKQYANNFHQEQHQKKKRVFMRQTGILLKMRLKEFYRTSSQIFSSFTKFLHIKGKLNHTGPAQLSSRRILPEILWYDLQRTTESRHPKNTDEEKAFFLFLRNGPNYHLIVVQVS